MLVPEGMRCATHHEWRRTRRTSCTHWYPNLGPRAKPCRRGRVCGVGDGDGTRRKCPVGVRGKAPEKTVGPSGRT